MSSQKDYLKLNAYTKSSNELVEQTRRYISQRDCKFLNIDISELNLIDTCKVVSLTSAYHFTKYQTGKIKFLVHDDNIKNIIKSMLLKNVRLETLADKRNNIIDFKTSTKYTGKKVEEMSVILIILKKKQVKLTMTIYKCIPQQLVC